MQQLTLIERALLFYGTQMPNHPRKWWLHNKLRQLFKIQMSSERNVIRDGIHWRLNPQNYTDNSLFWLGVRDNWEIMHLKKIIEPGYVILDVGANFGYYSLVLASALNKKTHIMALEPDPGNFKRLMHHITLNNMEEIIKAHQLGVSDCVCETQMSKNPENSGHTMITLNGEIKNVHLTTLDIFCSENIKNRFDLLMLDVEGFEEHALIGAKKTLAKFKPIIFVELFTPMMKAQGSTPEKVRHFLIDAGYHLFHAKKNHLVPLNELPTENERVYAFCFHSDNFPTKFSSSIKKDSNE